jgi:hypothetical protein
MFHVSVGSPVWFSQKYFVHILFLMLASYLSRLILLYLIILTTSSDK